MTPRLPANDLRDTSLVNSKHGPNVFLANSSIGINVANRISVQSGKFLSVSFTKRMPPLLPHVKVVIQDSTEPKMVGSYACWIVPSGTIMKNAKPIGYWAVKEYPAHAMHPNRPTLTTPKASTSVSFFISVSIPNPAGVTNQDATPKSVNDAAVETLRVKKLGRERLSIWGFREKIHLRNQDCFGYAMPRAVSAAPGHFIIVSPR